MQELQPWEYHDNVQPQSLDIHFFLNFFTLFFLEEIEKISIRRFLKKNKFYP